MIKIGEKSYSTGDFVFYYGIDSKVIINHAHNHNNITMVIFSNIRDIADNYPYSVLSNFIMVYEVPADYNNYPELINMFDQNWKMIEKQLDLNWSPMHSIKNYKKALNLDNLPEN